MVSFESDGIALADCCGEAVKLRIWLLWAGIAFTVGCATRARMYTLCGEEDKCIIDQGGSRTTVARLDGGVRIVHWATNGLSADDSSELSVMMHNGDIICSYASRGRNPFYEFSVMLCPTNVEYHIYQLGAVLFNADQFYSADYDGDGIPDVRYVVSGTNVTYTHGPRMPEGSHTNGESGGL